MHVIFVILCDVDANIYLEEIIRSVCDASEDCRLVSRWSRLVALGSSTDGDGASSSEVIADGGGARHGSEGQEKAHSWWRGVLIEFYSNYIEVPLR